MIVLKWIEKPCANSRVLPGCEVWRDVLLISRRLLGIWQGDKDHIRPADRFGGGDDLKSLFLRYRDGFAAFVKADDDAQTAVLEVQRVGVAL